MKIRKRNRNDNDREDAEQAAIRTSQYLYRLVAQRNSPAFSSHHDLDTVASTSILGINPIRGLESSENYACYNSAIRNGTFKGMREDGDADRPTSKINSPDGKNKKRGRVQQEQCHFKFLEGSSQQDSVGRSSVHEIHRLQKKEKRIVGNAWMCACCGAAFRSNQDATTHEFLCFQNVFHINNDHESVSLVKPTDRSCIPMNGVLNLSLPLKLSMVMTDESLLKAVQLLSKVILTFDEIDAEYELYLKAQERTYYECLETFSRGQDASDGHGPGSRTLQKRGILARIQNKLSHAYTLIKEGDMHERERSDQYNFRRHQNHLSGDIRLDSETQYINIIVKHSVNFVNNELDRRAEERWLKEKKEYKHHFDRLRAFAHVSALKLAKLALSSDLKPSKVAVQLSNDLSRLFPLQLKQFGAEINTEIEYRKGAYFVLSVNILSIDWIILMKHFQASAKKRRDLWTKKECTVGDMSLRRCLQRIFYKYTLFQFIEDCLSVLYHIHWTISVPICIILYNSLLRKTLKRFILTAVTDDFFQYVEKKGMEMDLEVVSGTNQAAFMLEALRQIRHDERDLRRRITDAETAEIFPEVTRGALLGAYVEADQRDVGPIPDYFVPPDDLETVVLQIDLPVGYYRLRRAFLENPVFFTEAIFSDALQYKNIKSEPWDKFDGQIGKVTGHDDSTEEESNFIGATMKFEYLMPKSAFVKENMAYEDITLTSYNDYFFSLLKQINNPDVPYGKTFTTLFQMTIFNTGNNSCRMVSSCEASFPNGPPFVARKIISEIRAGTQNVSVLIGETVGRYANAIPQK